MYPIKAFPSTMAFMDTKPFRDRKRDRWSRHGRRPRTKGLQPEKPEKGRGIVGISDTPPSLGLVSLEMNTQGC